MLHVSGCVGVVLGSDGVVLGYLELRKVVEFVAELSDPLGLHKVL